MSSGARRSLRLPMLDNGIAPDDLAASAVGQMERVGIMVLPVVDGDRRLVGVVHLHDLLRAGAV